MSVPALLINDPDFVAVSARARPANNYCALIGHSFLARCINVVTTSPRVVTLGYERNFPAWMTALSKGLVRFREQDKFAVSGVLVKDIYATAITSAVNTYVTGGTQLSNALLSPASTVYVDIGHNDVVAGYSFGRIVSGVGDDSLGLTYVLNQLTAAGKTVVLSAGEPCGNTSFTSARYSSTQLAVARQLAQWVTQQAPRLWPGQVFAIDFWSIETDRAGSVLGDVKAGITEDGLHRNSLGGYRRYLQALPVFQALGLPPSYPSIHQPGDIYDATNNPRGNLLTNGDLLGGTAISGSAGGVTYSGVRPTSWGVTSNGALQGGTSITVAGSQVTGTATGDWYQINYAGTTGATTFPNFQIQAPAVTLANMNVGDVLSGFGEFEIGSGSTGLCGAFLSVQRVYPGSSDTIQMGYGEKDTFGGVLDTVVATANMAGEWTGDLELQPWLGTETAVNIFIYFMLAESTTFSGAVRIRNVKVGKVVP